MGWKDNIAAAIKKKQAPVTDVEADVLLDAPPPPTEVEQPAPAVTTPVVEEGAATPPPAKVAQSAAPAAAPVVSGEVNIPPPAKVEQPAPATQQYAPQIEAAPETYTIQKGDSLLKIADGNWAKVFAIVQLNPQIKDSNLIFAGKELIMPSDEQVEASRQVMAAEKAKDGKITWSDMMAALPQLPAFKSSAAAPAIY
jgi:LysM repeat protein